MVRTNQQKLINCNSFLLEMKIIKPDGSDIDENVKIAVIDGLNHRILSPTIFLNGGPCKSNSYYFQCIQ